MLEQHTVILLLKCFSSVTVSLMSDNGWGGHHSQTNRSSVSHFS